MHILLSIFYLYVFFSSIHLLPLKPVFIHSFPFIRRSVILAVTTTITAGTNNGGKQEEEAIPKDMTNLILTNRFRYIQTHPDYFIFRSTLKYDAQYNTWMQPKRSAGFMFTPHTEAKLNLFPIIPSIYIYFLFCLNWHRFSSHGFFLVISGFLRLERQCSDGIFDAKTPEHTQR